MSTRKSFTANRVLPHTLEDARSAIIRTSRRVEDGRPMPNVIVDRKLGEGGYNEVYLVSWVSPSQALLQVFVGFDSSHPS